MDSQVYGWTVEEERAATAEYVGKLNDAMLEACQPILLEMKPGLNVAVLVNSLALLLPTLIIDQFSKQSIPQVINSVISTMNSALRTSEQGYPLLLGTCNVPSFTDVTTQTHQGSPSMN